MAHHISFLSFLTSVTTNEIQFRQQRASDKRIKEAGFPYPKSLDEFDLNFCQALTAKQLAQLRELTWIDGLYNMILAGPPGVGKTHLAIGLGYEACDSLSGEPAIISRLYGWRERMLARQLAYFTYVRDSMSTL